jgi:hypothetical protein
MLKCYLERYPECAGVRACDIVLIDTNGPEAQLEDSLPVRLYKPGNKALQAVVNPQSQPGAWKRQLLEESRAKLVARNFVLPRTGRQHEAHFQREEARHPVNIERLDYNLLVLMFFLLMYNHSQISMGMAAALVVIILIYVVLNYYERR